MYSEHLGSSSKLIGLKVYTDHVINMAAVQITVYKDEFDFPGKDIV